MLVKASGNGHVLQIAQDTPLLVLLPILITKNTLRTEEILRK